MPACVAQIFSWISSKYFLSNMSCLFWNSNDFSVRLRSGNRYPLTHTDTHSQTNMLAYIRTRGVCVWGVFMLPTLLCAYVCTIYFCSYNRKVVPVRIIIALGQRKWLSNNCADRNAVDSNPKGAIGFSGSELACSHLVCVDFFLVLPMYICQHHRETVMLDKYFGKKMSHGSIWRGVNAFSKGLLAKAMQSPWSSTFHSVD